MGYVLEREMCYALEMFLARNVRGGLFVTYLFGCWRGGGLRLYLVRSYILVVC